jgi:hypothetical protein
MSVAKAARLDSADTPGAPGVPHSTVATLPSELLARIAKFWPANWELPHVCSMRLLCTAFASYLRYRVYTHHPSAARFLAELRLLRMWNVRRSIEGQKLRGRAMNRLYCRHYEYLPSRPYYPMDQRHRDFHTALLDFMRTRGALMPPAFDGFVARLHGRAWQEYRFGKDNNLEVQFQELRESSAP